MADAGAMASKKRSAAHSNPAGKTAVPEETGTDVEEVDVAHSDMKRFKETHADQHACLERNDPSNIGVIAGAAAAGAAAGAGAGARARAGAAGLERNDSSNIGVSSVEEIAAKNIRLV